MFFEIRNEIFFDNIQPQQVDRLRSVTQIISLQQMRTTNIKQEGENKILYIVCGVQYLLFSKCVASKSETRKVAETNF